MAQTDPYQIHNLYDSTFPHSVQTGAVTGSGYIENNSTPLPESESFAISDSLPSHHGNEKTLGSTSTDLIRLVHRLNALMLVLKTCKGKQCTHPWTFLFPHNNVRSLKDALDTDYDEYFADHVAKVMFDRCEKGYISESEGPMWNDDQAYGMFDEVSFP